MARHRLSFLCLLAVVGCQATAPAPPPTQTLSDASGDLEPEYEAVTASALVFDPPILQDEPRLQLSRAERQPGVAVGYEGLVTERYYIRFDDRQVHNGFGLGGFHRGGGGGGSYDRYERRAVTERVGVRYR